MLTANKDELCALSTEVNKQLYTLNIVTDERNFIARLLLTTVYDETRMWANAQPDGRPAEHRWRPLFNAPKFG